MPPRAPLRAPGPPSPNLRSGTRAPGPSHRAGCPASPVVVFRMTFLLPFGMGAAFFLVRVIPWPVLLAFAPALWRAAAGLNREEARLDLRRLGWSEVAVATAFVIILVVAFRLTPLAG